MGNGTSVRMKLSQDAGGEHVVTFDLRKQGVEAPYDFSNDKGKFRLSFGLDRHRVPLKDAVELARTAKVETMDIHVSVQKRRRLRRYPDLGPMAQASQLLSEKGLVARSEREEGKWRRVGKADSDMGMLVLYGQVTRDVRTVLKVDLNRRNWLGLKRHWVVGQCDGTVRVSVKVEFLSNSSRLDIGNMSRRMASSLSNLGRRVGDETRAAMDWCKESVEGWPGKGLGSRGGSTRASSGSFRTSSVGKEQGASEKSSEASREGTGHGLGSKAGPSLSHEGIQGISSPKAQRPGYPSLKSCKSEWASSKSGKEGYGSLRPCKSGLS